MKTDKDCWVFSIDLGIYSSSRFHYIIQPGLYFNGSLFISTVTFGVLCMYPLIKLLFGLYKVLNVIMLSLYNLKNKNLKAENVYKIKDLQKLQVVAEVATFGVFSKS